MRRSGFAGAATAARVSQKHRARCARGIFPDPLVDVTHPRVVVRRRGIERNDRACHERDRGGMRASVHCRELSEDIRRLACLIDVVDAGDDDHGIGSRREHVAVESRADLVRPLAVHAAIQDAPLAMHLHQPVRVLAFEIAASIGRRLDRRS